MNVKVAEHAGFCFGVRRAVYKRQGKAYLYLRAHYT